MKGEKSEADVGAFARVCATVRGRTMASGAARPPDWVIVSLSCAGYFLVVVDVAVMNVALPSIRTALGFDAAHLQWVINGYALAFAGFLLLGGRAADLYGRRRVFLAGLAVFVLASLAGGLAESPGVLVVARFVQGIGAAVLSPASLTILVTAFPEGPLRARAIGTWAALGAAGGAFGTLLGGVLTECLSWRSVLLVNVPVGTVVMLASALFLTESRGGDSRRLDVPGAITGTLGLTALSYGATQTGVYGWTSYRTLIPLAAGLVALAIFLAIQARFASHPLMPLRLFRSRAVSAAYAILVLVGAAYLSMFYFVSLYLQNVLGFGPLKSGLVLVPHSLGIAVGARAAPRLVSRIGTRPTILVGTLVSAAGFLWQSRITDANTILSGVICPGVLIALSGGIVSAPLIATATSGVERSEAGIVSGIANTARMAGGSLGLAALAAVASGRTQALLVGRSHTTVQMGEALTAGYSLVFVVSTFLLLIAAGAAEALPEGTDKSVETKEVSS